jgi:hypothetical protein
MAFTPRCRAALALLAASALLPLTAQPAVAADPGRWREVKRSALPLNYYQGVAADSQQRLYFDGVYSGLYRTSASLAEQARTDDVIPPAVRVAEGYNHIGDIAWDAREGGRILLPMECYYPGGPGDGNTCKTGSIAVADPETLRCYYVKLDPAEIAKAMWNEVSPDGTLLWSQAGEDLLAYDMNQIARSNQAPAGPKLRAVRRLKGAVPPGGITGAAFYGGRLYAAGTREDTLMQVWSIDLADGSRRLEIEREVVGESEGLMVADVLSGVLHWMITPFTRSEGRRPTAHPTSSC